MEAFMSKKTFRIRGKNRKKENSGKKTKRKIIVIAAVCTVVVLAVVGFIVFSSHDHDHDTAEIYSYHGQTIELFPDGKFSAALAHNVKKNGTYTKTDNAGRVTVSFNTNGKVESGSIINNSLHIPKEWDDGHGHGNVFPRVKGKPSAQQGHSH